MHSPIKGNIEFVYKPAYLLKYTKRADVLLGELFSNAAGGWDRVSFMQLQYSPVSNFQEKGLVLSIVMGLLIGKSKRYSISRIRACLKGVEKERVG